MKNSTIAKLVASIFTISSLAGAGTIVNAQDNTHERKIKIQQFHTVDQEVHVSDEATINKIIKLKLTHESDQAIELELDINGEHQVFEFTQNELNDPELLAQRLAAVDEQTREHLINTLSNLNIHEPNIQVHLDDEDIDKQIFVFKTDGDDANFNFHYGKDGQQIKIIEKLLEHAELTPEQLDELQQLIDSKR